MIVEPKVRDFICTTAHPEGCAQNVKKQINYVLGKGKIEGPKKVLIIGASTGYGLASRITTSFGCGASTIGVMFEKPSIRTRTATPGWYNTAAFEQEAKKSGLYAVSINGDAFSSEIKQKTIARIKEDLGAIDLVIYSLAAPRRTLPDGTVCSSVLKTTEKPFTEKCLNLKDNTVGQFTLSPATKEEISSTIKVMGGEDWSEWIDALYSAGVLSPNASSIAYSYQGSELTYPVYYNGTIGKAKEHLYHTAEEITRRYEKDGIHAYISMNKAVVTQASAAIPIVPLYISLLYKLQKENNTHEGCIEQIYRLFHDKFCVDTPVLDENNMFRVDDYELSSEIQRKIFELWENVTTDNVKELADIEGFWDDFYQMFGFRVPGVDYAKDVEIQVPIAEA